jgi:hypothetical protein
MRQKPKTLRVLNDAVVGVVDHNLVFAKVRLSSTVSTHKTILWLSLALLLSFNTPSNPSFLQDLLSFKPEDISFVDDRGRRPPQFAAVLLARPPSSLFSVAHTPVCLLADTLNSPSSLSRSGSEDFLAPSTLIGVSLSLLVLITLCLVLRCSSQALSFSLMMRKTEHCEQKTAELRHAKYQHCQQQQRALSRVDRS